MKKNLLLFTAMLLLGGIARAADGDKFYVDFIEYTVLSENEKAASVSGYSDTNKNGEIVVIPSEVENNSVKYAVTSIGEYAFSDCINLKSVTIPTSVTSIGTSAFEYTGLTSVAIPESVTSIGEEVFCGCENLTSVTIPESITSISEGLFWECTGLISVIIPESVTSIDRNAFYECTGLKSAVIPNSVTSIGENAFSDCRSLTSVNIPESITSIDEEVFSGCKSLTSITIPESVTFIGWAAFANCTALTDIYCRPVNPPTCDESPFYGVTNRATLHVPEESVDAYKKAPYWKDFLYIEGGYTGIKGIGTNGNDVHAEYFNLNGMRVVHPTRGIYIKCQDTKVSRILISSGSN